MIRFASSVLRRSASPAAAVSMRTILADPKAFPVLHQRPVVVKRFLFNKPAEKTPEDKPEAASSEEENSRAAKEANAAQEKERLALLEKITALEDKYKRSLAETENVRSRLMRQVDEAKIFGIQGFCKDLIDVADVLQLALDVVPKEDLNREPLVKKLHDGVAMTHSQLLKVFDKHGLKQINPLGEKFDPNLHEALFEVPDPAKESGSVAVVAKVGYMLQQRVIRAAKVGVVKAAA